MPIEDPKIKDRPETDPKKEPDTGPDAPVKEPTKKPEVKEPEKKKPETKKINSRDRAMINEARGKIKSVRILSAIDMV